MKNLIKVLNLIIIIFIATTFSDCDLLEQDDCDVSARTEIEVGIQATVHVLDANRNPIANQELLLSLYKKPCGADIKGKFDFNGPTNADGIRVTTTAFYKLRNLDDMVFVDAYAQGLGNGSAEDDGILVSYSYSDFNSSGTKYVDVYIYRNF